MSNNKNHVDISEMINKINRGGKNIKSKDLNYMVALEELSKPSKKKKMSTSKR